MVKRWNHNAFTGTTSKNLTHVLHKANEILHFESRVLDIVNQTWVKNTDLYRLYAVTLHLHGEVPNPMNTSAVAGHYVTMICKNGIWYKYDDRKNATQHNPGSINPGALSLDDDDFSSGATPFMYHFNRISCCCGCGQDASRSHRKCAHTQVPIAPSHEIEHGQRQYCRSCINQILAIEE